MQHNKRTLTFKKKNCNKCKLANHAEIRHGQPGCAIFTKSGIWPEVENGHCLELEPAS